jgi:hypothetical protein
MQDKLTITNVLNASHNVQIARIQILVLPVIMGISFRMDNVKIVICLVSLSIIHNANSV